jgi:hypothetical protein
MSELQLKPGFAFYCVTQNQASYAGSAFAISGGYIAQSEAMQDFDHFAGYSSDNWFNCYLALVPDWVDTTATADYQKLDSQRVLKALQQMKEFYKRVGQQEFEADITDYLETALLKCDTHA